ncbi:Hypothetical predicted protein, partial [Marmota monax]
SCVGRTGVGPQLPLQLAPQSVRVVRLTWSGPLVLCIREHAAPDGNHMTKYLGDSCLKGLQKLQ